jgi:uncharacterized membrane protein
MGASRFSMGEAVRFGWGTMKSNIGFFIGLLIIAFLIENLPGILAEFVKVDFPIIAALLSLAGGILGLVVQLGLIKISLKFCDGVKGQFDDLLSSFHLLLKFIGGAILYLLIILAGMLLFIIPGIIWGIKYSLFPYFLVDNEMGPIEAIKASGAATDGAKWDLFLFGMLLGLINIAGALLFLVGLFVTIPLSMVAYSYVYRQLAGKTGSVSPSAEPDAGVGSAMYIKMEA